MLPCVLGASMMLTGVNAPVSASSFRDTQGHWGQAAIDKWNGFGVVHGYAGAFRPGSSVTRAEFAVMMDNIMKYIEQEEQGFTDVDGSKWYYDAMMKLATAGVMKGADGKLSPNRYITRQEAAVLLANTFRIQHEANNDAVFQDRQEISSWAVEAVQALVSRQILHGKPDGTFRPAAPLTRVEAVTMLNNFIQQLITKPGEYSQDVNGNVVINSRDVTLKDMKISGDLYIAQGVGDGDVKLDNVEIAGSVHVRGGGINSIIFNNVDVKGALVVNRYEGKVRILATGRTSVSVTVLESGAMLVTKDLTGGGFETVEISAEVLAGHQVVLDGNFKKVINRSEAAQLTANGNIGELVAEVNTNVDGKVKVGTVTTANGANATVTNNPARPGQSSGGSSGSSSGSSESSTGSGSGEGSSGGGNGGQTVIPVTGVSLKEQNIALAVGETKQLTAVIVPSNATNQQVSWKVEDDSADVVTVDPHGVVTAVGEGTKTIQVITQDGGKSAQTTVSVSRPAVTVSISKLEDAAIDSQSPVEQAVRANSGNLAVKKAEASLYEHNHYEALLATNAEMQATSEPAGHFAYMVVTLKDVSGRPIQDTSGWKATVTGATYRYEPVFGEGLADGYKDGSFVLKMETGKPEKIQKMTWTFSHAQYADTTLSIEYIPHGTAYIAGVDPIIGDTSIGATLTAGCVQYEGRPTVTDVTYKWLRSDSEKGRYTVIEGAVGPEYTLSEADGGKFLRVEVAADRISVGGSVVSAPFGQVETPVNAKDVFAAIEKSYLAKNADLNNIITNMNLLTALDGYPGITISWQSDNEAAVSTSGAVVRSESSDQLVQLTATLSGKATGSKTYSLIVRAQGMDKVDIVGYIDPYFVDGYPQAYIKDKNIWVRFKLNAPADVYMVVNAINGSHESNVNSVLEGHAGKDDIVNVNDWPYFRIESPQVQEIQEFDTGVALSGVFNKTARVEFVIKGYDSNLYTSPNVTTILFDPETVIALDTEGPKARIQYINKALDTIYVYYNEHLDLASKPQPSDFSLSEGDVEKVTLYNYQNRDLVSSYAKLKVNGISDRSNLRLSYNGDTILDTADAKNKAENYKDREVKFQENNIQQVLISSDRKSMSVALKPGWNPQDNKVPYNAADRFSVKVEGQGTYYPSKATFSYGTDFLTYNLTFDTPLPTGKATVTMKTEGLKNWAMDAYPEMITSLIAQEIAVPGFPSASYYANSGQLHLTFAEGFSFYHGRFNAAGLELKVDNVTYPLRGYILYHNSNILKIDLRDKYSKKFKDALEAGSSIQIRYQKRYGMNHSQVSDATRVLLPDFDYITVTKQP